MWKYSIRKAFYKGEIVPCVLEGCFNPECGAVNLRYPIDLKNVTCPLCKSTMLASKFRNLQYDRKAYHLMLKDALINRIIGGAV